MIVLLASAGLEKALFVMCVCVCVFYRVLPSFTETISTSGLEDGSGRRINVRSIASAFPTRRIQSGLLLGGSKWNQQPKKKGTKRHQRRIALPSPGGSQRCCGFSARCSRWHSRPRPPPPATEKNVEGFSLDIRESSV